MRDSAGRYGKRRCAAQSLRTDSYWWTQLPCRCPADSKLFDPPFVSSDTFPSSTIIAISFYSLSVSDTNHRAGGSVDVTTVGTQCQR